MKEKQSQVLKMFNFYNKRSWANDLYQALITDSPPTDPLSETMSSLINL